MNKLRESRRDCLRLKMRRIDVHKFTQNCEAIVYDTDGGLLVHTQVPGAADKQNVVA